MTNRTKEDDEHNNKGTQTGYEKILQLLPDVIIKLKELGRLEDFTNVFSAINFKRISAHQYCLSFISY